MLAGPPAPNDNPLFAAPDGPAVRGALPVGAVLLAERQEGPAYQGQETTLAAGVRRRWPAAAKADGQLWLGILTDPTRSRPVLRWQPLLRKEPASPREARVPAMPQWNPRAAIDYLAIRRRRLSLGG